MAALAKPTACVYALLTSKVHTTGSGVVHGVRDLPLPFTEGKLFDSDYVHRCWDSVHLLGGGLLLLAYS